MTDRSTIANVDNDNKSDERCESGSDRFNECNSTTRSGDKDKDIESEDEEPNGRSSLGLMTSPTGTIASQLPSSKPPSLLAMPPPVLPIAPPVPPIQPSPLSPDPPTWPPPVLPSMTPIAPPQPPTATQMAPPTVIQHPSVPPSTTPVAPPQSPPATPAVPPTVVPPPTVGLSIPNPTNKENEVTDDDTSPQTRTVKRKRTGAASTRRKRVR